MSVMIMMPICDHGKSSAGIVQESWNSSTLLTHVASHSRTANKSWGHSGRRLLVIHSVDFQWMPGNGTRSKCIYLRCWSDLSLILFSIFHPRTDQQEWEKPTQRTRKRTTSQMPRCPKPLNVFSLLFFLQVCSAFRSGNGHQTHSLWSCHLASTARGG